MSPYPPPPQQAKYIGWNKALFQHFFNEKRAFKEVFLYLDTGILDELGNENNLGNHLDFIATMQVGVGLPTKNIAQQILILFKKWQEEKAYSFRRIYGDIPPYFAYLCLFVFAEVNADSSKFNSNEYYRKLELLIDDGSNFSGSFRKMTAIWEDMEYWLRVVKKERLGRFQVRNVGGKGNKYVGIPWSQALLSSSFREEILPLLFAENNLDADQHYSDEVIQYLLIQNARRLPSRMRKFLGVDKGLTKALVEIVKEELENWEGYIFTKDETTKTTSRKHFLPVLLGFKEQIRSEQLLFSFRVKLTEAFNFDGFDEVEFQDADGKPYILQKGNSAKLSHPLHLENLLFDKIFSGSQTFCLFFENEEKQQLEARWKNQKEVLLFYEGQGYGLKHVWLEAKRLEKERTFILGIKADSGLLPKVERWGTQHCRNFKPYQTRNENEWQNLPDGWLFFKGIASEQTLPEIPVLNFNQTTNFRFFKGLKTVGHNSYYCFAPPLIQIENFPEGIAPFAKGLRFSEKKNGIWEIEKTTDTLSPGEYFIELRQEEKAVARKRLELIRLQFAETASPDLGLNDFGQLTDKEQRVFGTSFLEKTTDFPLPRSAVYWQKTGQLEVLIPPGNAMTAAEIENLFLEEVSDLDANPIHKFLYILSNQPTWTFAELDKLLNFLLENYLSQLEVEVRYSPLRNELLFNLASLGHLEVDWNKRKIYLNPPQLVFLPYKVGDIFKFLLIGQRDKATLKKLRQAWTSSKFKDHIDLSFISQRTNYKPNLTDKESENIKSLSKLLLPKIIPIKTNKVAAAQSLANELSIPCNFQNFGGWELLQFSANVHQCFQSLEFESRPDIEHPSFEKSYFNLAGLKFSDKNYEETIGLVNYKSIKTKQQFCWIWENGQCAEVPKTWSRWIWLNKCQKQVLFYDVYQQQLGVPESLPLPKLLNRGLMLSSEKLPEQMPFPKLKEYFPYAFPRLTINHDVSEEIAKLMAEKLGQEIIRLSFEQKDGIKINTLGRLADFQTTTQNF